MICGSPSIDYRISLPALRVEYIDDGVQARLGSPGSQPNQPPQPASGQPSQPVQQAGPAQWATSQQPKQAAQTASPSGPRPGKSHSVKLGRGRTGFQVIYLGAQIAPQCTTHFIAWEPWCNKYSNTTFSCCWYSFIFFSYLCHIFFHIFAVFCMFCKVVPKTKGWLAGAQLWLSWFLCVFVLFSQYFSHIFFIFFSYFCRILHVSQCGTQKHRFY